MAEKSTQIKQNTPRQYPYGAATVVKLEREATVNESKWGKSCAVLTVQIPVVAAGMVIDATMWGRIPATGPDKGALVFEIGLPRNVRIPDDDDMAIFRSHALTAATSYREWDVLSARAEAALTGTRQRSTFDKPTRLVRKLGNGTVATVQTTASGAPTN